MYMYRAWKWGAVVSSFGSLAAPLHVYKEEAVHEKDAEDTPHIGEFAIQNWTLAPGWLDTAICSDHAKSRLWQLTS